MQTSLRKHFFAASPFLLWVVGAVFALLLQAPQARAAYQLAQEPQTNAAADINKQLDTAGKSTGLKNQDPRQTVAYIIYVSLSLLGMVFVGLVVYAGFLWLTAGGEEDKIKTAKGLITNGVIGIAIVLSAYGISRLVFNYLLKATVNPLYDYYSSQYK
ncbi:MAG: hypothetical protein HY981_04465 [Candidatus Magasanikbacteria bacterium]|nr:hypothetical protein [Candidatus Magasanikbacteria bacterium]